MLFLITMIALLMLMVGGIFIFLWVADLAKRSLGITGITICAIAFVALFCVAYSSVYELESAIKGMAYTPRR